MACKWWRMVGARKTPHRRQELRQRQANTDAGGEGSPAALRACPLTVRIQIEGSHSNMTHLLTSASMTRKGQDSWGVVWGDGAGLLRATVRLTAGHCMHRHLFARARPPPRTSETFATKDVRACARPTIDIRADSGAVLGKKERTFSYSSPSRWPRRLSKTLMHRLKPAAPKNAATGDGSGACCCCISAGAACACRRGQGCSAGTCAGHGVARPCGARKQLLCRSSSLVYSCCSSIRSLRGFLRSVCR